MSTKPGARRHGGQRRIDGGQRPGAVFNPIADDSATISARVPETWSDVQSSDWDLGDGPIGIALSAAPDIQRFEDTWIRLASLSASLTSLAAAFAPGEVLDAFDFKDDCQYGDRYDYETDNLEGVYDVWTDCGKVKGDTFVVLAANPVGADTPIHLRLHESTHRRGCHGLLRSLDSLAVAGAVESTQTSEQETLLDQPLAVVKVDTLNVRSGPGTTTAGRRGQAGRCAGGRRPAQQLRLAPGHHARRRRRLGLRQRQIRDTGYTLR